MTMTRFLKQPAPQNSDTTPTRRHIGLAWLAVWLLVAGTFGYRATTHEAASEAVASSSASTSLDRRLGRDPAYLKPIEQIEVGQRVALAINPTEALDDSLGTVIHPHVWRKIELRPDPHSHIVMLRPEWWVNERIHADAQTMTISIPEIGIDGDAEIISITACPRIPAGEGRVVTGTFAHLAQETIRLTINGFAEPIRCTPHHATWSVEAGNFVEAQDLQPGQHVLGRDGIYEVASIEHLAEPIEVFNLEIFGQHVYQITTGGMLVHNGTEDCSPVFHGTTDAETVTTNGLSMKELRKQGGELADTAGFSVTPHRDIADQFAAGRALERGGNPTVIETTVEELADRGVGLRSGTELTEAGELKISPSDFSRVGPGTFTRSN